MAVFQIGSIIRSRREEMGLSQEDLADGICAVPTLSRIENNERLPTKNYFEMLMQRLGYNITSLDFFVDKRDFLIHELKFKIRQAYIDLDFPLAVVYLEQFKATLKEGTKIDRQFLMLYQTLLEKNQLFQNWKQVIATFLLGPIMVFAMLYAVSGISSDESRIEVYGAQMFRQVLAESDEDIVFEEGPVDYKARASADKNTVVIAVEQDGVYIYHDSSMLTDSELLYTVQALANRIIATLLLQPRDLMPETILIDEPELGLHPYAISLLASLIKKAAVSKQIIVSTQSVELLNEFNTEDVVVVNHKDDHSTFF